MSKYNRKIIKQKENDKINLALQRLENYKYPIHNSEWICNRIDWAWNFRKLTKEQMEELTDRMINWLNKSKDVGMFY